MVGIFRAARIYAGAVCRHISPTWVGGHIIHYEWAHDTLWMGANHQWRHICIQFLYTYTYVCIVHICICNVRRECYQSIISPGSFNKVPVIIMKLEMAISKKYKTIFMRLYLKSEVMTGQNFEKNAALSTHIVQIWWFLCSQPKLLRKIRNFFQDIFWKYGCWAEWKCDPVLVHLTELIKRFAIGIHSNVF